MNKNIYRRLLSGTLLVSVGVLLGRISGFFRESFIAANFGISVEADMAVLLLTVPDVFLNLLMGGALSVVLIPAFQNAHSGSERSALLLQSSMVVVGGFVLIALLAALFSGSLVGLLAPGIKGQAADRVSELIEIVLWVLPLTALAGVTTSLLQSEEKFLVPALGTLIFNSTIVCLLFFGLFDLEQHVLLAVSILIGAGLRWLAQLIRAGVIDIACIRGGRWLITKEMAIRYFQAIGAAGILTLLPVIGRAVSSVGGEGQLAAFNYAVKLVELPLAVIGTAFAVGLYPMITRVVGDLDRCREILSMAIKFVAVTTTSAVICIYVFSEIYVDLVFGWGVMSQEGVDYVSSILVLLIVALPLQSVSSLQLVVINAFKKTRYALKINLFGLSVFLPAAIYLESKFGIVGISVALVSTYFVILVAQSLVVNRMIGFRLSQIFSFKGWIGMLVWLCFSFVASLALEYMLTDGALLSVAVMLVLASVVLLSGLKVAGLLGSLAIFLRSRKVEK